MTSLRSWLAAAAFLVFLGVPSTSSAGTPENPAGGFIARSTITRVVVHDWQESIFVFFSTRQPNPDACPKTGFATIRPTHKFFKELYATALAASLSGTSVGGWVFGCDPTFGVPILTRLDLLPDPNAQYPGFSE